MINGAYEVHPYTKLNPRLEFPPEIAASPMNPAADSALAQKLLKHGYNPDSRGRPGCASWFQPLIAAALGYVFLYTYWNYFLSLDEK